MPNTRADTGNPPLEGGGPVAPFVPEPIPVTLLDLDAAGLDPTQPAPPEFIQFLYDNSQEGYLTLWSARLGEPDMPTKIRQWIDEGLAVYHARTIQTQMAPPTPEKPAGDHITEVTYTTGAPANASSTRTNTGKPDVSRGDDTKVSGAAPKEGAAKRGS